MSTTYRVATADTTGTATALSCGRKVSERKKQKRQ